MNEVSVEKLRELLDYDPETGVLKWKKTVNSRAVKGSPAGNLDPSGYVKLRIAGVLLRAHRVAWAIHHGVWPDDEIDHRNRVRNDNRIGNLRIAGRVGNTRNYSPLSLNAETLARSIRYVEDGRPNPWRVEMKVDRQRIPSRSFDNLLDAAACAASTRNKMLADFAVEPQWAVLAER